LVLLTHHQPQSGWNDNDETHRTRFQYEIAKVLHVARRSHRRVLWLFGHEHQMSVYRERALRFDPPTGEEGEPYQSSSYSRCIGHGGFPNEVAPLPRNVRESGLQLYDDSLYHVKTEGVNTELPDGL